MSGFVFTPIDPSGSFPRVSASEQSARDVTAEQLVADEFDQAMPEQNRAALETEYQQRFGKSAPGWEFTPLSKAAPDGGYRFVPLDGDSDRPSVLKTVALNNPATAAVETGAHLATMGVAMPVAGMFGLYEAAGNALGLHDRNPADVVHHMGDALTYQPRGEMGQAAATAVMAPFEKLHEAATWAGEKTQDATGSPAAATAAHTLIEGVLPLAIGPAAKAGKAGVAKARDKFNAAETPKAPAPEAAGEFKFTPIEEVANEKGIARTAGVVDHQDALPQSSGQGLEILRGSGDNNLSAMGGELPAVSLRRRPEAEPEALAHADQRGDGVLPGERGMVAAESAAAPDAQRLVDQRDGQIVADEGRSRPGGAGEDVPLQAPRESSGTTLSTGADGSAQPRSARYALVEAKDLKPQDRYAQPDWYAREKVTQEIVGEFEPNRLIEAMDDAGGAPIVLRDGTVEVGHKRAEALQRIYQANGLKAENYRQHLRDSAASLGLDPAAIDQMKKPVLVRVHDGPVPRRAASADISNTRESGISIDVRKSVIGQDDARGVLKSKAPAVQAMAGEVQNSWAPGQNYVPLRDAMPTAAEQATTKTTKPIRREDVLRPFLKALDINVYHGRVTGKRLGYYMPKRETLRVKNKSDLEVTAHEIGHLLDDRIPAIREAWRNDKELRAELKGISYDKTSVSEGYAESLRLFLTAPEALEAAAPKAYGWLETFADTHPLGPALRDAQRGMVSWYEQSALDRAKSKIGDPTSLNNRGLAPFLFDKWDAMRKGFRQSVVDDLDGIRLAEMNLTGKLSPLGAYETARLTRAAASITDGAVRFGHPVKRANGSFTYSGKGLEEILRPVAGDLDNFMAYAVGRSARELMAQGREHLFTPAEIRAAVALETPEFRTAWAGYQTWNKGVLDFAESFGILNPETRKLWKRQEYLPFWRVGQGVSGEGAVSGQWAGVKGLKGGTGNLREPLQNMTMNANALITAALKNDARARVVEMIEAEQGGGKFMQKIPAEARPVKIDAKQVQEAVLKDMGIGDRASLSAEGAKFAELVEKQIAEAPEFYQFFVGGQAPKGSNIVAVMKAGKPEYFEVADPLLLRALTALDRPAQSWIIKLLGFPKRLGQASIVLDPTFMAANFSRDQISAGVMTRSGYRPLIDAMDGMRRRMTNDPLYREWVANGGAMSSLFLDESSFRSKLEQFYTKQGIDYKTVIDSPKKLLNMVETFSDAFESATRIGEMGRALAKGDHPRHAAYKSREVSVDFSMAGDAPVVRAIFDTVIFLRAAVVSWDRLYRGVKHDPNNGLIAAKAASIGLASAALYLMNRGDPRYDNMADHLKDSHWHVFLGSHHFMIPKAFEWGAIGSIAERSIEKVMDEDLEGLAGDVARIIKNNFRLNMTPQFAAPLVEQYANKNSFTTAPIETPGMENVQPFLRAKPGTSETMKAAGMATKDLPESLQINPVRAEALLRGYANSWAAYALLASDRIFFGDKLPEMRADEMPVVKRFYQSEPPKHTRFESMFYEYLSESKRLRGTLRELDDLGLRNYADAKEESLMAGEAKPLERAAKNLSGINLDMEAVRRDGNLTPAEKRQKLDGLTVERNALLKAAVTASKAAQKAKALTPADIAKKGLPR